MELLTKLSEKKYVMTIFSDLMIDIDSELPKYKNLKEEEQQNGYNNNKITNSTRINPYHFIDNDTDMSLLSMDYVEPNRTSIELKELEDKTWWEKLWMMFSASKEYKMKKEKEELLKKRLQEEESKKKTIVEFFADVKAQMTESEVTDYENLIKNYMKELSKAKSLGQKAIYDKMRQDIDIMKYETILQAKGVKYLTEEQVVKLGMNTQKGISLDYIKNFGRIIPDDVCAKKIEADSWMIFDNYAVMHYDPKNNGSILTKEEMKKEYEKRKDPILFGLIAGSTKLYYISDWIDPYCDLTLEKAISIINSDKK